MPSQLTYPGVYIEEVPSGVRTITGVATAITAFIGRALRGPVDEPVRIQSIADFERTFGGLWVESAMSYAVQHYFRNGGSDALIVRIIDDVGASATIALDAGSETLTLAALQAGAGGNNLLIDVVHDTSDTNVFSLTVTDTGSSAGSPETFDDITISSLELELSNSQLVRVQGPVPTARPNEVTDAPLTDGGVGAAEKATIILGATSDPNALVLEAANPGVWGTNLQAIVDHDTSDNSDTTLFNLTIQLVEDEQVIASEMFRNLSVNTASKRFITEVLKEESNFVRVDESASLPNSRPDLGTEASQGGGDGPPPGEAAYIGSELEKTGIHALRKVDLFNILCIPPATRELGDDTSDTIWTEAHIFCKEHRAMLIVDPPSTWNDTTAAETGVDVIRTLLGAGQANNAAVYFPRLKMADPLKENRTEVFVPCGAVAGIMARTDAQRGVWKAPAGLEASFFSVREFSYKLTDGENGRLNPLGINCLRSFPGSGNVVWGARTLAGADRLASEWKYVPVRRLALFIEESLFRGTQWVVFEPNDEPLWSQIRLNVGSFMQNLFRQGAFQGSTPREAYLVKCDRETTTQNDIDLGIVNIVVGFAPLKPAEFVVIKIQQLAGQLAA